MEQVEGGDLIVNKGEESRPKESGSLERDLNAVRGYKEAVKLARVYRFYYVLDMSNPS